jgi:hypothetical protein
MKKCCYLIILLLQWLTPKAQSVVQEATFHLQTAEYSLALEKSLFAFENDFEKKDFDLVRIIALSYERMGMLENSLKWYERLILPKNTNIDDHYYYAVCLKNNGEYLKAIQVFKKYQSKQGTMPVEELVQSCIKALGQHYDSTVWTIRNMDEINTAASEFGWISCDSGFLMTSDRQIDTSSTIAYHWTGLSYQKIYYVRPRARVDSIVVDTLPAFINRRYAHAGAISLSPTGDTLFFSATDSVNIPLPKVNRKADRVIQVRNGLYYTVRDSGQWQKPIPFLYNDQHKFQVMHPAIDRTGNILVFASDQPGGYGGLDLYYSIKERDSFWSPPCNLGSVVNSSADEVFPVFDEVGRLRFSSNRLMGLGSLDIYELSNPLKTDTVQGVLIHLPYPFNSAADDFYLIDGKDGKKFFSSNRPGGQGLDDIYEVRQKRKPLVKFYFDYTDSSAIPTRPMQAFVGMRDLRTRKAYIKVLSQEGFLDLPVSDTMFQVIEYFSYNGKKVVVNDTIQYHPSYPKYGMVKRYPSNELTLVDDEKLGIRNSSLQPFADIRKKKKGK